MRIPVAALHVSQQDRRGDAANTVQDPQGPTTNLTPELQEY